MCVVHYMGATSLRQSPRRNDRSQRRFRQMKGKRTEMHERHSTKKGVPLEGGGGGEVNGDENVREMRSKGTGDKMGNTKVVVPDEPTIWNTQKQVM